MAPDLRIPARADQTATIIFLHGLGQTNESWSHTLNGMAASLPSVEWILPQAPENPVSLNCGQRRSRWFDLHTLPPSRLEWDHQGVTASAARIEAIIRGEMMRGIDPRHILLVGFSQGAVLALLVALSSLLELGGVASLSGWIPQSAHQASAPPARYISGF
ncbi:Phospholipase/carboxylesterase/thioesterase [Vararia minispora EC-137]|uniref:Phospholipase/carboxylesterase/thioesterase n=1 Tax=Vararia minispora EC-137 TaxID=1314806 RepID=A0ACB8Q989_9AGAM|nr:Phospholipase/carboxylesterase/thioesterase [Vararia minispora EC-137]